MGTTTTSLRITPDDIQYLDINDIFVFGSNLLGRHAGGAADLAFRKYGAIKGIGIGAQGRSFAIPTLGVYMEQLPLEQIEYYVKYFTGMAELCSKRHFLVTKIGCGIAGFKINEIAPMFRLASKLRNVYLPQEFWDYLNENQ